MNVDGLNQPYAAEKSDNVRAFMFWFITLGYMAAIFFLSSLNAHHVPSFIGNHDKIAHACIYFPLAFLIYHTVRKSGIRKYIFITAFLLSTLYGISDEFHQTFVDGRIASLGDVFADSFGAFAGSLAASFMRT